MTSLNPLMTIGRQIEKPLVRHLGLGRAEARARTVELLVRVGIPRAVEAARSYPHQLSGGMRQRVMIAIALACRPVVLIADEPTTALDVTIQAQILDLLRELQDEMGTAILLITHDLAVIAETADRVAVMYAGRIVESAPVAELFARPLHPYTEGLLRSVPSPDPAARRRRMKLGGDIPSPANPNYHRGAPKFRQFIHKFVPEQLMLYAQAKTGEVDDIGLGGVPADRWGEARALPDRDLLTVPQPWVQFIYFNCGKHQFKDAKVRKALYMASEMQKSIDDIYFGNTVRTLSYLQPTRRAYNPNLKNSTPNPEAAARMLDEAGWKIGTDGVREKDGAKMKFTPPRRQHTKYRLAGTSRTCRQNGIAA